MPLPLVLMAGAAVAGTVGVANGANGAKKMIETNDEQKSIQKQHQKNMTDYEVRLTVATQAMDILGEDELKILSDFTEFSDVIEQIENRPEFGEIIRKDFNLPDYSIKDIKDVSVGAVALVSGAGGVAAGTFGGFAAAGATTSAVMALGTASTGTAISTLSGAAATNATLAALGGGAVAAGGGGVALGTTVLGVTTLGVGLMVGGVIFNITGNQLKAKTAEAHEAVDKETQEVLEVCYYLEELSNVATNYHEAVMLMKKLYEKHFARLQYTVLVENKRDYREFTETDKLAYSNTVLLVGILYDMLKTNVVNSNDSGLNETNAESLNLEITNAAAYLKTDPLANDSMRETLSIDVKEQTIDFSVYEEPEEEVEEVTMMDQLQKGVSAIQEKTAESWEKVPEKYRENAEKAAATAANFGSSVMTGISEGFDAFKRNMKNDK